MATRLRSLQAATPKGVLNKTPNEAARGHTRVGVRFSTRYALSARDVKELLSAKEADPDPEDALWIFEKGAFEKIQGDDQCPPGRIEVFVKVPRGFGWVEWPDTFGGGGRGGGCGGGD